VSAFAQTRPEPLASQERRSLTRRQKTLKRTMDIIGSALLLLFSAPLVAVFAARIKLHDGGPVFFRRRVVGPGGEFDAFKLRTMRVDADEILQRNPELRRQFEVNFKLKDDPRITPAGAALRRSGLDELPQLWNVLKGEMSLVGPRMITPAELRKYGEAGWIFAAMKPGLTGSWQVDGDPNAGYDLRVSMDLSYVENWSLGGDVKLLMRTPWRVLRGSGV